MSVPIHYTRFEYPMQTNELLLFPPSAKNLLYNEPKVGNDVDITTLLGLIIGFAGLLGGYTMDGGHLSALSVPSAMLIVFGGTIGAVVVSFPGSQLKGIGTALNMAFRQRKQDPLELIDEIVEMATIARREGVLALEQRAQENQNPFLHEGLLMVVDGTDPELTRQILELEMDALETHHEGYAKIFEAAGGFAPTMGIIGTVLGLIHVLGNLTDPDALAPAIAVAFTATLYGVFSANVIYLPIGTKIKIRSKEQIAEMELMLEGILALQAGENPQLIRKKLMSFLHLKKKQEIREEGADSEKEK